MSDIIKLLPDSVANQIAAGEVIQRPASVVKELMENSVDSGADKISVIIKDSGKTLVQVMDNGCGMTETDARLAFERHATSKIRDANDLFSIRTFGFRGEALPSIASVAEVDLKSRQKGNELGTELVISASKVSSQEAVSCSEGTNIAVKNLFFNIPARRKFLKSDSVELRNILNEFQRVVLAHPDVEFSLFHNNTEIYNLPKANLRQRIIRVFGKNMNQALVDLNTDTSIIKLKGYIGKLESAKKTTQMQFFFVNGRFMKHPAFHSAVMKAYEQLIPSGMMPAYFIFFEVNPDTIDVNIHPAKTEIKFEEEKAIWQIIHSSVRESLGKNDVVPAIDFNTEGLIDIPFFNKEAEVKTPEINYNPFYNPFEEEKKKTYNPNPASPKEKENLSNWQKLYAGLETRESHDSFEQGTGRQQEPVLSTADEDCKVASVFFQFKNKYILLSVKSGLMVIDQKRAHERILYEKYLKAFENHQVVEQKSLFPQTVELNAADYTLLLQILEDVNKMGFDIRDFGNNTVVINGYPAEAGNINPHEIIETVLNEYKNQVIDSKKNMIEKIASSLAKASAIDYGKSLKPEEMREVFDHLFACTLPNFSPSGKNVISIIQTEELEKRF